MAPVQPLVAQYLPRVHAFFDSLVVRAGVYVCACVWKCPRVCVCVVCVLLSSVCECVCVCRVCVFMWLSVVWCVCTNAPQAIPEPELTAARPVPALLSDDVCLRAIRQIKKLLRLYLDRLKKSPGAYASVAVCIVCVCV